MTSVKFIKIVRNILFLIEVQIVFSKHDSNFNLANLRFVKINERKLFVIRS